MNSEYMLLELFLVSKTELTETVNSWITKTLQFNNLGRIMSLTVAAPLNHNQIINLTVTESRRQTKSAPEAS